MSTATTHTETALSVGDRVQINDRRYRGRVWVIEKMPAGGREVNALIKDAYGHQRFTIHPDRLLPEHAPIPYVPCPALGSVVTVSGVRRIDPDAYYVVVKVGDEKANLARLGGSEGDRYWRSVDAEKLTIVPFDEGTKKF